MQVYKNYVLSDILWYKIGGKAKYLIEVASEKDIEEAFKFVFEQRLKRYFVVGMGANLLFSDEYYDGAVIRITTSGTRHPELDSGSSELRWTSDQIHHDIKVFNNEITAFAGVTLDAVIQTAFAHKLVGLEWAGGLPSTIGAAIRGNVGAFGGEIKDVTKEAKVLRVMDHGYNIGTISNEALEFGYRNSKVKQDRSFVVLSATFALKEGSHAELISARTTYQNTIKYRNEHHPSPYIHPNTGSTFKNIKDPKEVEKVIKVWPDVEPLSKEKWHGKISVGYINKRLGFSGFTVGGAQVSTQHANFINNMGNAKARDVIAVIRTIQKKYQETFGFHPEPEVEIVE